MQDLSTLPLHYELAHYAFSFMPFNGSENNDDKGFTSSTENKSTDCEVCIAPREFSLGMTLFKAIIESTYYTHHHI